ncbi:MAG: radical SAM protein [Gallionella sp.]|jgi:radical SAM protein with 4Fe4S-binding SPASM domain
MKTQDTQSVKKNFPVEYLPDVDWDKAIEGHKAMLAEPYPVLLPRIYQLETTSRCNLTCIMCPRKKMTRPVRDMDDALFDTILERDMKGTKAVELFGFGEPFCDRKIGERIKKVQDKGIKVTIATNGLLLKDVKDEVIASIDYLVYDYDALTPELYRKVRVGGDHKLMMTNLSRVLDIRTRAKKYTVIQFIKVEGNIVPDRETLEKTLKEEPYVEWRSKFLDTFAGQVSNTPDDGADRQERVCCLEPFYGVSVWSNGDVVMCDRDFNSVQMVGNLRNNSLVDLWYGEKIDQFQQAHKCKMGEKLPLCSHCKEWGLTNLRNVPELTVNMFKGGFV